MLYAYEDGEFKKVEGLTQFDGWVVTYNHGIGAAASSSLRGIADGENALHNTLEVCFPGALIDVEDDPHAHGLWLTDPEGVEHEGPQDLLDILVEIEGKHDYAEDPIHYE